MFFRFGLLSERGWIPLPGALMPGRPGPHPGHTFPSGFSSDRFNHASSVNAEITGGEALRTVSPRFTTHR